MSYKIDQGAEIVYPSSLTLLGTRCTFEGLVVGVHRLIVAEGADVAFASTTQTGINQSTNQSINQSINQLINQPIGRKIDDALTSYGLLSLLLVPVSARSVFSPGSSVFPLHQNITSKFKFYLGRFADPCVNKFHLFFIFFIF